MKLTIIIEGPRFPKHECKMPAEEKIAGDRQDR